MPSQMSGSGRGPTQMSGNDQKVLLDVREWLETHSNVQEWSEDPSECPGVVGVPPGCPGVVGRPSWKSGSGQKTHPDVRQ